MEQNKYSGELTEEELNNIENEFSRLKGETYLDHAGATLYGETQMKNVFKDLSENLYLNPHTSKQTTDCIDQVRYQVLEHFHTNIDEYSIIFTSGATASLKLVAESFEFSPDKNHSKTKDGTKEGAFIYDEMNHTSVLGMREIVCNKSVDALSICPTNLWNCITYYHETYTIDSYADSFDSMERALYVCAAQCNFSGFKYDLNWVEFIQDNALNTYTKAKHNKIYCDWSVLLDAASFVSTNNLNLSEYKPDFVCLSFYKIFGFPTGLGALLVKNTSAHLLDGKSYYGGGTVDIAMSKENFHIKRSTLHERFEDGTIPFLSIIAVKHGFDALYKLIPATILRNTMDRISLHTFSLAKYLYSELRRLHHFNRRPVVHIYRNTFYESIGQGGIVNFNLKRANGDYIGYAEVIHMAELFSIHLRSGCFCNPGACQSHLRLSDSDIFNHLKAGHVCGDKRDLVDRTPTGSIRVSFGYMSTFKDIKNLLSMIIKCFVEGQPVFQTPTHTEQPLLQPEKDLHKLKEQKKERDNFALTYKKVIMSDEEKFVARGTLKEIHIYPVKSCAAYKICTKWEVGSKGFKFDREWMIVRDSGVALTQKQDTRMCLIQPAVNLEENILTLSFPRVQSLSISIDNPKNDILTTNSMCQSKVCGDNIEGKDCGDEVADWLSDVLGLPGLRLIKQSNDRKRIFKQRPLNGHDSFVKPISLSNKAQYLAINISSVKWLATKIENDEFSENINNLTERFRGNLIIESGREFQELRWKKIKIGNVIFEMEGPCTRCQMVCINQESGEKTIEPLRTISKLFQGKIYFGVYLSHQKNTEDFDNIITCGEKVYALESQD